MIADFMPSIIPGARGRAVSKQTKKLWNLWSRWVETDKENTCRSDGSMYCEDKAELGDRELGSKTEPGKGNGERGGGNKAWGFLPWTWWGRDVPWELRYLWVA